MGIIRWLQPRLRPIVGLVDRGQIKLSDDIQNEVGRMTLEEANSGDCGGSNIS